MWRSCLLAGAAWLLGVSTSFACEDPENIQGVIYESIPADTPPDAIVLDVVFERAVVARSHGGPIEARVRRVVQGDFSGRRVRVGIVNSSCLYPFIFGTRGLIIGNLRDGFESIPAEVRSLSGERVHADFTFGFEGVWFAPKPESIRERRERTGSPPNLQPF